MPSPTEPLLALSPWRHPYAIAATATPIALPNTAKPRGEAVPQPQSSSAAAPASSSAGG